MHLSSGWAAVLLCQAAEAFAAPRYEDVVSLYARCAWRGRSKGSSAGKLHLQKLTFPASVSVLSMPV